MIFLDIVTMETVKRKINALKDEIERKDEGKTHFRFSTVFPVKPESKFNSISLGVKFCVEIRPVSGQKSQLPVFKFRPEVENLIFMFLDITVLREKLKK